MTVPGPLDPIDLAGMARLGGKTYGAAYRWWRRTLEGSARDPLPDKQGGDDKNPLWQFRTIESHLRRAGWITEQSKLPVGRPVTRLTITQQAEPLKFFPPGCFDDLIGKEVTLDVQGAPKGIGRIAAAKVAPGGRSADITIEIVDPDAADGNASGHEGAGQ